MFHPGLISYYKYIKMSKKLKIAIVQRVIFHYRTGLFHEISKIWTTRVFHGDSVSGSKVVNAQPPYPFDTHKLFTYCKRAKNNPQQILFFNPGLVPALWRWNPDILLLEGSNNMLNNIVVYLYCRLLKKKYIWWGIGTVPGRKESIYRKILTPFRRHIIKKSDAILAYCTLSAEYFAKITNRKKIHVFPNSLNNVEIEHDIAQYTAEDKESLRAELGLEPDCVTLLYVGALEPNKRLEVLFDVFNTLHSKGLKIKLLIIGSGSAEERFRTYAEKIELQDCLFLGKILTKVNLYFQIADIFVLPGRGGLAVNQALINGLPVVCNTPADGTELDMISHGKNGYLLEDMNAEVLQEHLEKMLSKQKYLEMGRESRKIVEQRYNINEMIRVLENVV